MKSALRITKMFSVYIWNMYNYHLIKDKDGRGFKYLLGLSEIITDKKSILSKHNIQYQI